MMISAQCIVERDLYDLAIIAAKISTHVAKRPDLVAKEAGDLNKVINILTESKEIICRN